MSKFAIRALIGAFAVAAIAAEPEYVVEEVVYEPSATQQTAQQQPLPRIDDTEEYLIPNSPILQPTNIITVRAIGLGVAPESTISPAQALVLAKRAAILDGYRQIGEKMYGIKINATDTLKDAVAQNSTVRSQMYAIIRNAEILETVFKDGLCQVEMEVKLDGRRWYRVLSGF
jgi:hypothetical protein